MKFTPKSEEEVSAMNLLIGGEYFFEVTAATEETSKAGNDMLKLQLAVLDNEDRRHAVFDYLVGTDGAAFKVRHFAESVGLLPQYERGQLAAEDAVGRTGRCQVGIDDKNKAYPAKNVIRDYLTTTGATTNGAAVKGSAAPAGFIDDAIPFRCESR